MDMVNDVKTYSFQSINYRATHPRYTKATTKTVSNAWIVLLHVIVNTAVSAENS